MKSPAKYFSLSRSLFALLFIWTCAVLFPAFPDLIGCGLDASWKYGLNLASAQRLIFGQDIVFTYGPLGYLVYPDPHVVSPVSVVLWRFSFYAASIYFLIGIVQRCRSRRTSAVILLVLSFTAALNSAAVPFGYGSPEQIHIAFLLACWFLSFHYSFSNISGFVLAGIIAGLSLLVKVNDGVIDIAAFYLIYAYALWQSKTLNVRSAMIGLIPPAAFCIAFVIFNGPLNILPAYLHSSFLIGGGYSEAMSMSGPTWQVVLAVIATAALAVILLWKVKDVSYCSVLLALLLAFAAFKHGMVQQDGHHPVTFHTELAAASVFGLLAATGVVRRRALIAFALANVCCGLLIAHVQAPGIFRPTLRILRLRSLLSDMKRYALLDRSWTRLQNRTVEALSAKRAEPAMVHLIGNGSVDDATWNIDFIRANHFRWDPCPVFQSYSAYDPALDGMNAAHLERAGADFLTLKFDEIDGEHLFLDNPLYWRTIFDRYDIAGGSGDMLLLKRNSGHRFTKLQPMGQESKVQWRKWIPVPRVQDDEVLVMTAKIDRSLWGSLRNFFFRVAPVYLEVTYQSGDRVEYRVTRANLVEGAIISNLPQSLPGMLPLLGYGKVGKQDAVAKIEWSSGDDAEFAKTIDLSWSVMKIKHSNPAPLSPSHL